MQAELTDAPPAIERRSLSKRGFIARMIAAGILALGIFTLPAWTSSYYASEFARAAIFAIIGLSLNILMGHAGQISLGHQAFVGVGAFTSGFMVSENGLSFLPAMFVAGLVGAASAAFLGVVALRLRGLYLALLTLAYGTVAEESIFNIRALTRGGEGMPAPRPAGFESNQAYLLLCLLVLSVVLLIDWRLVKSKAGRAIMAIRHDERVAATMGVNVTFYKILAFMLSGFIAGVAGSLFAHRETVVVAEDFVLTFALTWVFMTVVGGLGSRAGVVVGSAFFALFATIVNVLLNLFLSPQAAQDLTTFFARATPFIGALLLVLTLTLYPGGIGQQMASIRRWMSGGPFKDPHHGHGKKKHGKASSPPPAPETDAPDSSLEAADEAADGAATEETLPADEQVKAAPTRRPAKAKPATRKKRS